MGAPGKLCLGPRDPVTAQHGPVVAFLGVRGSFASVMKGLWAPNGALDRDKTLSHAALVPMGRESRPGSRPEIPPWSLALKSHHHHSISREVLGSVLLPGAPRLLEVLRGGA